MKMPGPINDGKPAFHSSLLQFPFKGFGGVKWHNLISGPMDQECWCLVGTSTDVEERGDECDVVWTLVFLRVRPCLYKIDATKE